MKGSYVLLAKLDNSREILVGQLGHLWFPQAFYAYVGSAMNGFEARLARHVKQKKKPHWHIDYLLNEAELVNIVLCPSDTRMECFLAQALAKEFQFIPGFGSSDCECASHLYFAREESRLEAKVAEVTSRASLSSKIFSPKERENGAGVW